jgi:hypothetical protein
MRLAVGVDGEDPGVQPRAVSCDRNLGPPWRLSSSCVGLSQWQREGSSFAIEVSPALLPNMILPCIPARQRIIPHRAAVGTGGLGTPSTRVAFDPCRGRQR